MRTRQWLPLLLLAGLPKLGLADQLVPAGSIITCTVQDKISSQTTAVGDPVLCTLGHSEKFGRTSFPYGSYLSGHFEAYKDPGHFVGKGWMELRFDKLYVQPDTVVPLSARVVATPGYKVDEDGRILGNGHATRDTIEWLIPVLWPIDLINLPKRGPRPVIKPETQLTIKVLDDFGIPTPMENAVRTPALISRQTPDEPTYQGYRQQAAPVQQPVQQPQVAQYQPAPQPQYQPQYQQQAYVAPQVTYVQPPPQVVYVQPRVIYRTAPVYYGPPPPPPAVYYRRGYSPYGGY